MAQNDNDERRQLMDRFLLETRDDPHSAFFTEDEIVEIFDYANDFDNDFVRCEALLYGASRYPDSDELRVRRGFQYFYQGVDVRLIEQVLVPVDPANTLCRILRIRINEQTTPDNIAPKLTELLNSLSELGDEEVIQLIDLAADARAVDWLMEQKDNILKRCSYLPTPLYEMADVLYEAGKFAESATLFDELVEMEPFNADFWCRLCESAAASSDYHRALEAADYALAIDPDDRVARTLKARVLFAMEKNPAEIASLLEPYVFESLDSEHPDILPLQIYASALSVADDNPTRASQALEKANEMLPGNFEIIMGLAIVGSDSLCGRALRFLEEADNVDAASVVALCNKIAADGPDKLSVAADIATAYFAKYPEDENAHIMFTYLYMAKRYEDVVALYSSLVSEADGETDDADLTLNHPVVLAAYNLSNLRLAKDDDTRMEAFSTLVYKLNRLPSVNNMQQKLMMEGFNKIMTDIVVYISNHLHWRASSLNKFDPFPSIHNTRRNSTDRNNK
ncbi:MAG: hypothetical protein NC187_09885 [Candidatus Amulumruptor caecigallinarius]|nr:hypothetical protein [Candidatus Amulumruptor caecigallinarius]MCM1397775.1 hypothetical protein [Candidatus Amulumruptor caecigallinarius]MCM1454815.1 hypothetical protein [bacterium]